MRGVFWATALVGAVGCVTAPLMAPELVFPWLLTSVTVFVVGLALAWKVPGNSLSWLMLFSGAAAAAGFSLITAASRAADPTTAGWLEAAGYALNTAFVLVVPFVLLRFPDGDPPKRRWRLVEWAAIAAASVGFVAALLNGGWGGDVSQASVESPLRSQTAPTGDVLSSVFFLLFSVAMLGSAVYMLLKYRASVGDRRLQFKWLAYAAGLVLVSMIVLLTANGFEDVATDETWEALLFSVAFAAVPVGIGVAVLRYRLYEIDVVISRTVVLAVLAGFITATYALVVVGLGALLGGDSDGLVLPIAATALVALAFEPVRLRAQRWANRLVYGNRATPYEVLSDLTGRLSAAEEGEGILDRMAKMLREGTGADRATIWLGVSGEMDPQASSPSETVPDMEPSLDGVSAFPVLHNGEVVGALEVVKPKGTALSSTERSLITDLAGSAGAVLGYQRLNDSLAQRAKELEASRQRLVEAQDSERRRLERELHEGAEQYIVALKVKLGVATQLARRQGADRLELMLDGLTEEAQAALDDVRSLAKGIYPPVLESDGLGAAVSALAMSTPVEVQVERDGIGRYPLDVEAAVYFDISEAVTNAVKHAEPPISIKLGESAGGLHFSVRDSGPGFELDTHEPGSGLENMADRMSAVGGTLAVETSVGSYTVVSGSVPIHTVVNTDGSKSDLDTKAAAPASSARDSYSVGS